LDANVGLPPPRFGGTRPVRPGEFCRSCQGHNLVLDPNSGAAGTDFTDPLNQDILGVGPHLGALAANGGPTRTHVLLAGSAAIDHGLTGAAPTVDQRGVARPRDGDHNGSFVADVGAFEA
jgi:hypothetical protein